VRVKIDEPEKFHFNFERIPSGNGPNLTALNSAPRRASAILITALESALLQAGR